MSRILNDAKYKKKIITFAYCVKIQGMLPLLSKKRRERKPSMRKKLFMSLGSLAMILLLSSVISILEYRRMSTYVSDLIAANIKSINLSQKLADLTEEYNHQMLSVVVQNDISLMPEFDLKYFNSQADSLKKSFTRQAAHYNVDTVVTSFNDFMTTSLKFDEVFLADSVDTGEWFFGTLQPTYNNFRQDMNVLNDLIHEELKRNSADFDAGFYRSVMPGVVSVGAGLILVILLLYFTMLYYVNPIYKISEGIDNYRQLSRRYRYNFDGDDQIVNINTGVEELIDENLELRGRIRSLKEEKEI